MFDVIVKGRSNKAIKAVESHGLEVDEILIWHHNTTILRVSGPELELYKWFSEHAELGDQLGTGFVSGTLLFFTPSPN